MIAVCDVARADGGKLVERASSEVAVYSDTDHVNVFTPSIAGHVENPTAGWSIDGSYLVDVISAASVDIVSTASRRWEEVRQGGSAKVSYARGNWGGAAEASISSEPDYLAYSGGGYVTHDLDERNLSLILGYGYGFDRIGKTGTPFSVFSHSFNHHAFSFGFTKVIDRSTTLALTGDLKLEIGDQSKPYRYIPLFSPETAPSVPVGASLAAVNELRGAASAIESLPLSRQRYALTARLSHRFDASVLRLESRIYDDSWSIKGFMSDAHLLFNVAPRWTVGPHLRYYVQSASSFWQRAYVGDRASVPTYLTGDRELGPLMNLTAGGSARWAIGPKSRMDAWILGLSFDATYTAFFDDLYITHRTSALASLSIEATW
ncbi:MAG: DUF3570 domain-containing protein [Polyangiaceae bacterium]